MQDAKLIVGLGNLGKESRLTRHNVGFMALDHLAADLGVSFQKKPSLYGEVVKSEVDGQAVILLKPTTYMNLSGQAVRKCVDFFKLKVENILVVFDDVSLHFGKLRIRAYGQDGGHNGIKSIDSHMKSQGYARLKIGIGRPAYQSLSDYVLSPFKQDELKELAELFETTSFVLRKWVEKGFKVASESLSRNLAEKSNKKDSIDETS